MCYHYIPVIAGLVRKRRTLYRHQNHANLKTITLTSPTSTTLSVGLWNCQSAVNKADFITAYANNLSLQLLALTETWIKPENTATPAALSNAYSFSHTSRPSGRGGGTGLLIANDLQYTTLLPPTTYTSFEYHAVLVSTPAKLGIIVIYRPPGQSGEFINELDMLLSSIPKIECPMLILGDMNFHLDSPGSADFKSLMHSFDLELVPSPPTHKAGKNLDLIFTRYCDIDSLKVTPLHLSDHFFIQFSICINTKPTAVPAMVTFRRNLRNLSVDQYSSLVATTMPSLGSFSSLSMNTATDTLCSTLSSCLDSFCPLRSRIIHTNKPQPWLKNESLRKLRSKLRAAERKWHKKGILSDLTNYQLLLASFSECLKTAKTEFYNEKFSSLTDSRRLFTAFRSLLNPLPPPLPTCLTAEHFASFFSGKVAAISSQFTDPPIDSAPPSSSVKESTFTSFTLLSEKEALALLTHSRPTTCPLDPIPTDLLQTIAPTIIPVITHVINISLSTGEFPLTFKQAQVTPLLKKPSLDPALVDNYRPVSLLPFLSKCIERAVYDQISGFLTQNNHLDHNQSGFKKGHSTEMALLSVSEALKTAKAAGQSSVLILLDLSAAFDTVNHDQLLSTLSNMGISDAPLSWFRSYLADRSFKVSWLGQLSSSCPLSTGVPQGSVLGPLLFSIYTTSLGPVIRSHGFSYHCFADDTQLYLSFPPDDSTISARISHCLSDISSWMKAHHLQLNLSKTELLVFPAKQSVQRNIILTTDSFSLSPAKVARNLGVMFDDQLSFTHQVASVARSCRFALYNIRLIRPFLTQHATQLLVQAVVISRLDYCNAVLTGLPACAIKPLQMIQNAAARLVFNLPKRAHVTPLFIELHWLPVAARIKYKACTVAYKVMTEQAPYYLHLLLKAYVPSRPLRSSTACRLALPSIHTGQSRLFSSIVPRWWNELPTFIRAAESLAVFKKLLKTELFREYLH